MQINEFTLKILKDSLPEEIKSVQIEEKDLKIAGFYEYNITFEYKNINKIALIHSIPNRLTIKMLEEAILNKVGKNADK